jgi:hypothetical protein
MRVIGEVEHSEMKITIFHWNNKYLVKFEQGFLEQTYKVSEMDIIDEAELRSILNTEFLEKIMTRFQEMGKDWFALI